MLPCRGESFFARPLPPVKRSGRLWNESQMIHAAASKMVLPFLLGKDGGNALTKKQKHVKLMKR
jgi:hypothetical protein